MVEGMTTPISLLGRRKSFVVTLSINERLTHLCRDIPATRFWSIAAYRVIDLPNSHSFGCVRNLVVGYTLSLMQSYGIFAIVWMIYSL